MLYIVLLQKINLFQYILHHVKASNHFVIRYELKLNTNRTR